MFTTPKKSSKQQVQPNTTKKSFKSNLSSEMIMLTSRNPKTKTARFWDPGKKNKTFKTSTQQKVAAVSSVGQIKSQKLAAVDRAGADLTKPREHAIRTKRYPKRRLEIRRLRISNFVSLGE